MQAADGFWGLKGWQWMFLVEGLPGCFLAVVAYFYLTDRPSEAKWLSEKQKAIVLADLEAESSAKSTSHASFKEALKDKRFYLLVGMAVALISGIGGLALWVPAIIRLLGVKGDLNVGLLGAIPYVAGVAAQQLIARNSDKRQERMWHAAAPAALAAVFWACLPFVQHSVWLSLGCLSLISMGTFGATGPFWATPTNFLKGRAAAGGIALITTCGSISAFFSPILVGWAADRTGNLSFGQFYYGTLMAIGVVLLLLLGKIQRSGAPALDASAVDSAKIAEA